MNVSKTKDMVTDFRRFARKQNVTILKGQTVECVQNDKYLGLYLQHFEVNCEALCKKGHWCSCASGNCLPFTSTEPC